MRAADPFVVLRCGAQERATQVEEGTVHPLYQEVYKFLAPEETEVRCDVWDYDGCVSPRFEVLRRLHAIDARRVHQTRSWVVSFSVLREFGPRRCSAQVKGQLMGRELYAEDLRYC